MTTALCATPPHAVDMPSQETSVAANEIRGAVTDAPSVMYTTPRCVNRQRLSPSRPGFARSLRPYLMAAFSS